MARAASGTGTSQAPRVSWLRRVLGPFYFTGVFWFRFFAWIPRALPEPWLAAAAAVFPSMCLVLLGGVRRALGRNLEPVLGPAGRRERWRRAWRTLRCFSWMLCERYEQFTPNRPFEVRGEGLEHWDAALAAGRGAVLITAHLGSWENASTIPTSHERRTVHIVREEEADPKTQAFVADLLTKHAGPSYVTHFASNDPSLSARLLTALRDGELVALQGDRPRQNGRVHIAEAFGRQLPLPLGPAMLARAADVPLIPLFGYREGRRRQVVAFRPPIHVAQTDDKRADVAAATAAFARELEAAIRRDPHQWYCFGDAFLPDPQPFQARSS